MLLVVLMVHGLGATCHRYRDAIVLLPFVLRMSIMVLWVALCGMVFWDGFAGLGLGSAGGY